MAQRTITILTDDLTGDELTDGSGETVEFSVDGTSYQIDLSTKNAEKLRKALAPYIERGRRVSGSRGGTRRRSSGGGSGMSKEELADVRAWAKDNGYEVSERGRIKQEVIEAYQASQ